MTEEIKEERQLLPIPGFPGYFASSTGYIWSYGKRGKGWHLLKSQKDKAGYPFVSICVGSDVLTKRVHQLVCLAFHGLPLPGQQVRHVPDPDRSNTTAANLKWGTLQENIEDAIRNGTRVRGSKHGRSKLIESDIPQIRALTLKGYSQTVIARMFGVSTFAIYEIQTGKSWQHVKD